MGRECNSSTQVPLLTIDPYTSSLFLHELLDSFESLAVFCIEKTVALTFVSATALTLIPYLSLPKIYKRFSLFRA